MGKRGLIAFVAIVSLCWSPNCLVPLALGQASLPRPDHIVIVIEENKNYGQIVGSANAPYINSLIGQGALLTSFYALHHPSQPNYLELFSGEAQGVYDDECPQDRQHFSKPSLGGSLLKQGYSFVGYADALTPTTSTWQSICHSPTHFAVKHCPWMNFQDVTDGASLDFKKFPTDAAGFKKLPTVAFVIPDLVHDMHYVQPASNTIPKQVRNGDAWLKSKLDAYLKWSKTNNSLLIVIWDEDDSQYPQPDAAHPINTTPPQNHIAAILVGAMVAPGAKSQPYTHYDLLRTIEEMYGLPLLGGSKNAKDITGIWK